MRAIGDDRRISLPMRALHLLWALARWLLARRRDAHRTPRSTGRRLWRIGWVAMLVLALLAALVVAFIAILPALPIIGIVAIWIAYLWYDLRGVDAPHGERALMRDSGRYESPRYDSGPTTQRRPPPALAEDRRQREEPWYNDGNAWGSSHSKKEPRHSDGGFWGT